MRTKLVIASFWTLSLLFGMLATIILLIFYKLGAVNLYQIIGLTILLNVLLWLFSPRLTDWIQKIFYKAVYYKQAEFSEKYPRYASFITEVTQKNKTPFPKIGFIDDDNPTAFSYGSGKWNSRLVITKGILTYLEEDEVKAVLAHELGHIVHRDFIVMSIANAIIQLLYEISYVLRDTRRSSSNSNDRGAGSIALIGYLAFVFYWIGSYIVLFLNRLREYYADEFSAQTMEHSEPLENALVKIAYGIMAKEDTDAGARLLKSTQTMGIMSLASAKSSALAVKVSNFEPDKVAKVMLFDVVSPWAWLGQISATHPLTGRRLLRLEKINAQLGRKPRYDLVAAKAASNYSRGKMWRRFLSGSFVYLLPGVAILLTLISVPIILITKPSADTVVPVLYSLFPGLLLLFLVRVMYMFPSVKKAVPGTVYDLMTDLYASPLRGRPVSLEGKIVGRGVPGYMFGEDMMLQDKTGLLYIDYKGAIPLISNLLVALKKLKTLVGKEVSTTGWFYRSNTQFMRLKLLVGPDGKLRSYQRAYSIIGAFLMAAIISAIPLAAAVADGATDINVLNTPPVSQSRAAAFQKQTVGNVCYQVAVPKAANTTIANVVAGPLNLVNQCSLYASSPVNSDTADNSFDFRVEAVPMTSSFHEAVQTWQKNNAQKVISDLITTVDNGLPAEKIIYSPNASSATPPQALAYLIDSSGKITGNGLRYFTAVTTTYTTYNSVQLTNIVDSLKINTVNLSQILPSQPVVTQGAPL